MPRRAEARLRRTLVDVGDYHPTASLDHPADLRHARFEEAAGQQVRAIHGMLPVRLVGAPERGQADVRLVKAETRSQVCQGVLRRVSAPEPRSQHSHDVSPMGWRR